MKITLNGTKHTIPDGSTHVAADDDGYCYVYFHREYTTKSAWVIEIGYEFLGILPPPEDFTKCCAKVFDGAVIDFEGM